VNYKAPLWVDLPPVKPAMGFLMGWVIGAWKWRVLRWGCCDSGGRPRGLVAAGS
jgi:hypothetical protein